MRNELDGLYHHSDKVSRVQFALGHFVDQKMAILDRVGQNMVILSQLSPQLI